MRDKVWGSANSLFKWRFRSRRRRFMKVNKRSHHAHNFPKASMLNICARARSRDMKKAWKTE